MRRILASFIAVTLLVSLASHALGQDGQLLTNVENQLSSAAKGWEDKVMGAAEALFWILAGIEIGIAAIWLALSAAALDSWFAELVRRILFIGFFLFVLEQGPAFAKAVVDSLFQIGADGGSASPADVFDAGMSVARRMSEKARFGLFEDNSLAIATVFSMILVVVSFSLVAAIFLAVMVEMYVGLLAGMIMLGLGGSSFTKDFAVKYLVYAFSVGMKLMALVMIARIGSEVLLGLAQTAPSQEDQFLTTLAIGGISVAIFIVSIYVPNILQGLVQGASVTGGMEVIRHGGQAASFAAGGAALAGGGAKAGAAAYSSARAGGSGFGAAALKAMSEGVGASGGALASAVRDKAIGVPGTWGASTLGLANAKLDERSGNSSIKPSSDDKA